MQHDDLLGRVATLTVQHRSGAGALLTADGDAHDRNAPSILLPAREVPDDTREGERFAVFVYLDGNDIPVATLREPKVTLDRVAFLEVTDLTRAGAWVDWGMPEGLLVPTTEITRELRVGERHAFGLVLDNTGRLAGTMRVAELLRGVGEFVVDEWVAGEAWRHDPSIGTFIIVEKRFAGLVPADEPHTLERGDAARFRVSRVLPDGKINLSLRGHGHGQIDGDAERILARLSQPGAPRAGDKSSPEALRELFGLSKKAFKRAVGNLFKRRLVTVDAEGYVTPVRDPNAR